MEGNQMKMREALLKLRSEIGRFCYNDWIPYDVWQECDDVISHALSSPPRNCDVGTVEEQTKRMRNNCNKYKPSCKGCKYVTDLQKENCWLAWAQMPYEAEEGGKK